MKFEDEVRLLGIKLEAGENFNTLVEDYVGPLSGGGHIVEGRRSRAKAIFEYIKASELSKHSRQMKWATWVIAGATVFNLMVVALLNTHRYSFQFPNPEVVIREDHLTGKIASELTDYPWVNGYITNPNLLQTIYQVGQDLKIMEMKRKETQLLREQRGQSQSPTSH